MFGLGRTVKAEVSSLLGTNYDVLPFKKQGVAQRWYYAYSEKSRHSRWLAIDFDAKGTIQHIRGESDFPEDVNKR